MTTEHDDTLTGFAIVADAISRAVEALIGVDEQLGALAASLPTVPASDVSGFMATGGSGIPPGSPGPRSPFVSTGPYNPFPARISGIL